MKVLDYFVYFFFSQAIRNLFQMIKNNYMNSFYYTLNIQIEKLEKDENEDKKKYSF